jgi:hypothetical protein
MPALWLRGLLPSHLTELQPGNEPSEDISITYVNDNVIDWSHKVYYGDASGGEHTEYKTLRRVGVSVIFADENGLFVFGIKFNLPGAVQTVGRGELLALVVLARFLPSDAQVEFVTDNQNVFKTYNKGRLAASNSVNCDLFAELFDLIATKHLLIKVRWMPAHLSTTDELPTGVSSVDVLANDHADRLAKEAAAVIQLSKAVTCQYIYNAKLVGKYR